MSIRARVTLAFALSMAAVLFGAGLFVHLRLGSELTAALDDQLETKAAGVARLIVERGGAEQGITEGLDDPGESFTQVIGPGEELLSSSPGLPSRPVLSPDERANASEGVTADVEGLALAPDDDDDDLDLEALEETQTEPFEEDTARLLSRSLTLRGERLEILVGVTYEDRNEALDKLSVLLLLGLAGALILACAVGYGTVRGALAPVERMRRRAATISDGRQGARLPVPSGDDELARLGRTLNHMLDRLEAALERERSFVADASHELRTPVAIMRTEIDVALRGSRTADELEDALRSLGEEAGRLSNLADSLLLIARSDKGQLALKREPLDAGDLLRHIEDRWSARAKERGRSLTVEVATPATVEADRQRIEQALDNLIENGLRHGRGDIEVTAREADGSLEIVVGDYGPGFQPDFLPHAFDRFTRAERSRTSPGSGLGLSIVAAIAQAHGGSAQARNRDGGGAEIVVRLPTA